MLFQVEFAKDVFPEKIEIFETFNAGAVQKIQVMQPDNKWYTAWETATVQRMEMKRTFSPNISVCMDRHIYNKEVNYLPNIGI